MTSAARIVVGRDGSVGIAAGGDPGYPLGQKAVDVNAIPSAPAGYRWQQGNPGFLLIPNRSWKGNGRTQYALVRAGNTTWLALRTRGTVSFYRAVPIARKLTDPYPIRGIGAAPDVSAVGTTLQAGDTYLGSGEYDNAVQAYRAAGQAAVTLSKQYGLTMPAGFGSGDPNTDQNAQLQAITDTNDGGAAATQATAQQAQGLAYAINGAIVAAAGSQGSTPGGGTAPNAPGTNTDPLLQATQALCTYYGGASPTTAAVQQVGDFQAAWNATGAAALTVDKKYGSATQGAFQAAITAYGLTCTAPQNAFSTTPVTPPPAPPLPAPGGGGQNTIIVWWESLPLWQQILLGGAAAGGTYVAGKAILKKHPVHKAAVRHGKRAIGHLKRHSSHMARRLRPRRA